MRHQEEAFITAKDSYASSHKVSTRDPYASAYKSNVFKQVMPPIHSTGPKDVKDIYAMLKPERPLTASNGMAQTIDPTTKTLWHKENRGLRSEGKFKTFMENVRDARMSSEALLNKNAELVYNMHEKTPEKIDMDEHMEKNYLQIQPKNKLTVVRSSRNADLIVQEKKFKSMRKALNDLEYEKQNPKKVVKHITGFKVDPSSLAQPKFISYEFKEPPQHRPFNIQNEKISFDKAVKDLAALHVVDHVDIPSDNEDMNQEVLEQNIEEVKRLKDNLNQVGRCVSAKSAVIKVVPPKDDLSKAQEQLDWESPPKSARILKKKHRYKKETIERRTKGQTPVEDFLKRTTPIDMGPGLGVQPGHSNSQGFDFSVSKLSLNLSNFAGGNPQGNRGSPGVFGHTQVDTQESRYSNSPFRAADSYRLRIDLEDGDNEVMFRKHEKIKKILQRSTQGKHTRVPDTRVLLKERYNVSIESNVCPQNAGKIATETKDMYFLDRLDSARKGGQSLGSSGAFDKTKKRVFNSYRKISQACETVAKQGPVLQTILQKGFQTLDVNLRKMNEQFSWQEVELDNQIKQDIFNEMHNSSTIPLNLKTKSKKAVLAGKKRG